MGSSLKITFGQMHGFGMQIVGLGLLVLVCNLLVVSGDDKEEWIDPNDMLNYDPSTKSMRKQTAKNQVSTYAKTDIVTQSDIVTDRLLVGYNRPAGFCANFAKAT